MPQPYRYGGELQDDKSRLIYLRARYYDPSVGRFISEDSYEGQIDNPLSLNLYTYVHNNPLTNIDPSGHWCESADGKWAHAGECDNGIRDDRYSDDMYHDGDNQRYNGFEPVQAVFNYPVEVRYLRWKLGDASAFTSAGESKQEKMWTMAKSDWTIQDALSWTASGLYFGLVAVEASFELMAVGGVRFFVNRNAKMSVTVNNQSVITSANRIYAETETEVGHSLAKHMSRKPDIWGKPKGNTDVLNQRANQHLQDILNGEGNFQVVQSGNGVTFLEKTLSDGRGIRLNMDGTFKGFIDK
ncbi:RHS repeat-associated core domain-containing protein [Paenibacillus athensensis]|nr:RHS repeat-associated core domain-containing protein [Paenibacillus athensensis]